ncbi:uncharacterized protein LOC116293689 [Actinia tenebrosa]|uniref:Uncharacterized protein LOC116293689 n=1 Tax=Actinia tenebrosa TaxID=6105 RepID=A0A6P8HKV0_ACTTE|nr:uncharacterized protein LOC116293689 [Actinia tenebrosa]
MDENDKNIENDHPSFDEVAMWRVEALKEFLRKRNLKVTGKKQELVARVFAAFEQRIPISLQGASLVKQTKEEQSRLLTTDEGILPDPLTLKDCWFGEVKGISQWPPIFLSDITMYIMKDHPGNNISLQTRLLNEYKEGKAYRLYDTGWLKEISINHIKDNSKYCFMKARCTPSMKINDTPHNVWICASKVKGSIQSAYCSCTAG